MDKKTDDQLLSILSQTSTFGVKKGKKKSLENSSDPVLSNPKLPQRSHKKLGNGLKEFVEAFFENSLSGNFLLL